MSEEQFKIPPQEPDVIEEDFTKTGQRIPTGDNTLIQQVNAWATSFALWFFMLTQKRFDGLKVRFTTWWESLFTQWERSVSAIKIKRAEAGDSIDKEIQEEIDEISEWPTLFRVAGLGYLGLRLWWNRTAVWLQGLQARDTRKVNADLRPTMLSAGDFMRYLYLYPNRAAEVAPYLDQLGLEDEQQRIAFDAMRQVPQYTQILMLRNRDEIDDITAIDMFQQGGVSEGDAELLLKTRMFYPGPADIASLTGREAFEEESIKRFDLDADFDRIPKEVYEKAGMSEEVMRWYWIAHWQNPGINQVFRMLHRLRDPTSDTYFSDEDMDIYFNLADITPAFRERLKAISYLPLTRVDTRRMYGMGVMDRDEVYNSYRDQGYDDANAQRLTDFTVKSAEFTDRDLSRGQIEKLYEYGELSYDEFIEALEATGYDNEEAYFLARLKIASMEEKRLKSFIDRAEWEYKRGLIDRSQVNMMLGVEGISAERIDDFIEQWDNENISDQTLPTKTDVIKWHAADIIDDRQAIELLQKRHYSAENIDRYLGLIVAVKSGGYDEFFRKMDTFTTGD